MPKYTFELLLTCSIPPSSQIHFSLATPILHLRSYHSLVLQLTTNSNIEVAGARLAKMKVEIEARGVLENLGRQENIRDTQLR